MKQWIEVIETNRKRNTAYIAWQQDDPFWATNVTIELIWIEEIMGCKFRDGFHPYVRITLDKELEIKLV